MKKKYFLPIIFLFYMSAKYSDNEATDLKLKINDSEIGLISNEELRDIIQNPDFRLIARLSGIDIGDGFTTPENTGKISTVFIDYCDKKLEFKHWALIKRWLKNLNQNEFLISYSYTNKDLQIIQNIATQLAMEELDSYIDSEMRKRYLLKYKNPLEPDEDDLCLYNWDCIEPGSNNPNNRVKAKERVEDGWSITKYYKIEQYEHQVLVRWWCRKLKSNTSKEESQ